MKILYSLFWLGYFVSCIFLSWYYIVAFITIGLAFALYKDLTCPHQKRLYWDKK